MGLPAGHRLTVEREPSIEDRRALRDALGAYNEPSSRLPLRVGRHVPFQAPGFYAKLGYREFGRLDYPPEHQRIFLQKHLLAD